MHFPALASHAAMDTKCLQEGIPTRVCRLTHQKLSHRSIKMYSFTLLVQRIDAPPLGANLESLQYVPGGGLGFPLADDIMHSVCDGHAPHTQSLAGRRSRRGRTDVCKHQRSCREGWTGVGASCKVILNISCPDVGCSYCSASPSP